MMSTILDLSLVELNSRPGSNKKDEGVKMLKALDTIGYFSK